MPQLSPLNWIFIFLLFWFIIFLTLTLIWWQSKLHYKAFKNFKNFKSVESKWCW